MKYIIVLVSSLAKVKDKEVCVNHNNENGDYDSDDSPGELVRITEEPKEKWDCESILSEFIVSHQYFVKHKEG